MTVAPSIELSHGITCIDTLQQRPGMACCYLLQRGGEYAFIEAGTAPGVERLLALLEARKIPRESIRYVIITHVHLDHAGGAGALMAALPKATLVAHPRAARHVIDPSKLIAGAEAVYGKDVVAAQYGNIVPVAADRVVAPEDGVTLPFGDSELEFIDTPGHARHHFSIWDSVSQGFFTGDTFGLSYREFDDTHGPWIMPTTTPVQFEPDAWDQTIDRYLLKNPQRMFLTHFGVVDNVAHLAAQLRAGLRRYVTIAQGLTHAEGRHEKLKHALAMDALAELSSRQTPLTNERILSLLEVDLELNAQGLAVWLDRAK